MADMVHSHSHTLLAVSKAVELDNYIGLTVEEQLLYSRLVMCLPLWQETRQSLLV